MSVEAELLRSSSGLRGSSPEVVMPRCADSTRRVDLVSDRGQQELERCRVVVKELGSRPLACEASEAFDETVVVAQVPGESAAAFARRAVQRIELTTRNGRGVVAALLQVGSQHDEASNAARRLILSALVGQLRAPAANALLLDVPADATEDERQELLALVQGVLAAPRGGELSRIA